MSITRRDVIVLALFVLVLAVGSYVFVRHQLAPPERRTARPDRVGTPETVRPAEAEKQPDLEYADFAVIPKRNLFRAAVPKAQSEGVSAKAKVPAVLPARPGPMLPTVKGRMLAGAPPGFPAPGPRGPKIAVTGVVRFGKVLQALIENVDTGESRLIQEGDSAFGYRLSSLQPESAVLERPGEILHLALGENKPVRAAGTSPGQPTPPPPPSPGQGSKVENAQFKFPSGSNASEEMRARWKAMRQKAKAAQPDNSGSPQQESGAVGEEESGDWQ